MSMVLCGRTSPLLPQKKLISESVHVYKMKCLRCGQNGDLSRRVAHLLLSQGDLRGNF